MAEWSIAAVLKTVDLRGSGGSNPSLSAEKNRKMKIFRFFCVHDERCKLACISEEGHTKKRCAPSTPVHFCKGPSGEEGGNAQPARASTIPRLGREFQAAPQQTPYPQQAPQPHPETTGHAPPYEISSLSSPSH